MLGSKKAVLCNTNLSGRSQQKHKHTNKPGNQKGHANRWCKTNPYLLESISSSPPLHQEVVALGEACGRHSRTASPPLWITVDFFTGRRVKSGGEAEEEIGVEAVGLWRSNSSAENVSCITGNYGNCISPPKRLIVQKKYVNGGKGMPQWGGTSANSFIPDVRYMYTYRVSGFSSPPMAVCVWWRQNHLLTYNLELSTGIDRAMLIMCYTLIHPRIQQADPGYGQFSSLHVDSTLQIIIHNIWQISFFFFF